MQSTWKNEVNWFSISEHARVRCCFERQRTSKCNCVTGRKQKYNPCDRHTEIEALALAIGLGETGGSTNMNRIYDWLRCYTCQSVRDGRTCSHRACDKVVHLMNFVHQAFRKAA